MLTVKSLVRNHAAVPSRSYRFCRTRDCDVVYFADVVIFRKPDLKVRIGIKETDDPIPLCYCFGYTREDVRRQIRERGSTDIPHLITAEVKGGFCACEVKNPAGSCCLGEINRVVSEETAKIRPPLVGGRGASAGGHGLELMAASPPLSHMSSRESLNKEKQT
jgi:hypothetical protein